MIYTDKLIEKSALIRPIIYRFVETAFNNQSHKGDFFLLFMNGFYDENCINPYNYTVSQDWEEIASESFDYYIKRYLENKKVTKITWKKILPGRPAFQDYLISIHNEKSIYLRYWEADTTLQFLYQLVRLCRGLPYDWKWKQELAKFNCRQEFIRKHIKVPLKTIDNELFQFFINNIKRQIRNAIAHSQYCLLDNNIKYLNYKRNDNYSQIALLKYNDWEDIIHNTIAFRNELTNALNQIHLNYIMQSRKNKNIIEVRITKEIEVFSKIKIGTN